MFTGASIIGAFAGATGAYLSAKQETKADAAERELVAREDEHLLPLLTAEQASAFLAGRQRLRERREDIKRQERQHRERMAVESRKASALEAQANRPNNFALGFILGQAVD